MYAGTAIAIMELATTGPATNPVMKIPPTVKPAVSWARDPGLSSVRGAIIIKMRSVIDSASRTAVSCLCNARESKSVCVCVFEVEGWYVCTKWGNI